MSGEIIDLRAKTGKGDQHKATGGLTAKQAAFARLVGQEGKGYSDAYREVYEAQNMSAPTVWKRASELAAHGEVAARIDVYIAQKEMELLRDARRKREWVLEQLEHEAVHAETDGARVRALELLGKSAGVDLFTERVEKVGEPQSAAELEAALRKRLDSLIDPSAP
jgi:hypothetical protein